MFTAVLKDREAECNSGRVGRDGRLGRGSPTAKIGSRRKLSSGTKKFMGLSLKCNMAATVKFGEAPHFDPNPKRNEKSLSVYIGGWRGRDIQTHV